MCRCVSRFGGVGSGVAVAWGQEGERRNVSAFLNELASPALALKQPFQSQLQPPAAPAALQKGGAGLGGGGGREESSRGREESSHQQVKEESSNPFLAPQTANEIGSLFAFKGTPAISAGGQGDAAGNATKNPFAVSSASLFGFGGASRAGSAADDSVAGVVGARSGQAQSKGDGGGGEGSAGDRQPRRIVKVSTEGKKGQVGRDHKGQDGTADPDNASQVGHALRPPFASLSPSICQGSDIAGSLLLMASPARAFRC
jgi:hypothetical protein